MRKREAVIGNRLELREQQQDRPSQQTQGDDECHRGEQSELRAHEWIESYS
jgi:hypothetical protein